MGGTVSVSDNSVPADSISQGAPVIKIYGMIDAHAHHNSLVTWPAPLRYVQIDKATESDEKIHIIDAMTAQARMVTIRTGEDVDIRHLLTADIGDFIVKLNTSMYNENNSGFLHFNLIKLSEIRRERKELLRMGGEKKRLEYLEEEERALRENMTYADRTSIPSLVIASTMDMEFAHYAGYDGTIIPCDATSVFQGWKVQVADTEMVVESNPFRFFPFFSYDPRRYRYSEMNEGCEKWNSPFAYIVGSNDSESKIHKIWLGFCMNPQLGFRPFDEFCEHLPHFYKKCMDDNIPILAHCAPEGVTTHDANSYKRFDISKISERIEKDEKRCKMIIEKKLSTYQNDTIRSGMYRGIEKVVNDAELNHIYMNYGHPRNWIPVLEYFPKLHLCLSGFGGNSEWQHETMREWAKSDICKDKKCEECKRKNAGRKCVYAEDAKLPTRQWIRCIIKLIGKYNDVYTDISGLNIYNDDVRSGLDKLLRMVHSGHEGCKHLRDKLIFGSDWYFTYLTDVSMGNSSVPHNYNNYCRKFKALFSEVDDTGKFWERVSLINPWFFYTLSDGDDENKNKIKKMYTELTKLVKNNEKHTTMLNDMYNKVFNGDGGLIKYVSSRKEGSPDGTLPQREVADNGSSHVGTSEQDEDLIAVEEQVVIVRQDKNGLYIPDSEKLKEIVENVVTWVIEESGRTYAECPNKKSCTKKDSECPQKCSKNATAGRTGPIAGSICKKRCERMLMACSHGVREAFKRLTNSHELENKMANDIYEYLHMATNFTQIKIDDMQRYANEGHIVIAAAREDGHGHVVMGVPGEEISGKWDGDRENDSRKTVPVVMETGSGKREKSIGINYSWGLAAQKNVVFYRYNRTTSSEDAGETSR